MRELIMTIIDETDVLSIGGNPQNKLFIFGRELLCVSGGIGEV
jgi:hypothetical protein